MDELKMTSYLILKYGSKMKALTAWIDDPDNKTFTKEESYFLQEYLNQICDDVRVKKAHADNYIYNESLKNGK